MPYLRDTTADAPQGAHEFGKLDLLVLVCLAWFWLSLFHALAEWTLGPYLTRYQQRQQQEQQQQQQQQRRAHEDALRHHLAALAAAAAERAHMPWEELDFEAAIAAHEPRRFLPDRHRPLLDSDEEDR